MVHVIMGATGHVGSAAAQTLLDAGQPVIALTRDASHARALEKHGAQIVEVDVYDVGALRTAFRKGRRAFLLNPPGDVAKDSDAEERETVRCILAALEGSGLERVVAESTYGAQPGERIGDLSTLYDLERGLAAQSIPAQVQRAAYYMSNWDGLVETARTTGTLPTMLPADLKIPMVAPVDLGRSAARLLLADDPPGAPIYVEGPARYSSRDVATAFAVAFDRDVEPAETARDQWIGAYRALGFSEQAADSYARMTAATVDQGFPPVGNAAHGSVSLEYYVGELVSASSHSGVDAVAQRLP